MGNTPSLEAPRRPQKLSKPPLCLQPPDTALLDLGAASTPPHGRFSKSYLVGSVPITAAPPALTLANSSPVDPKDPLINAALAGDEIDIPLTPPTLRLATRPADIRRWSSVSRTTSFHSDFSQRRSSSMVFTDSRPNSIITDCTWTHTRPESLVSLGRRGSVNYDVRSYEAQRLMTLERDIRRESMVTDCESHSPTGDITENTWKSCHPAQPDSSPVTRTNSDVSLYLRVRRRSLIQTPGVATRSQPSENSFSTKSSKSTKSSSRSSVTATPDETRHNSIESELTSQSPEIPEITRSEPLERVVTPCEGQYKQLGGIKFGSLRVVNVSPQPSPRPSSDIQEREENISPRNTSPPSYFDRNAPSSAMIAPLPTDEVPVENAARSLFKNPFEPSADPILENSRGENGSLLGNAEFLYVRDDPNAKPTAERIRRELESKALKSLSRSDSGFVSSPSSEGSRKRISKADSGYSSNVSLRSLRSLKSAVTDLGRKSPEKTPEKAPESLNSDKPSGGVRVQPEPKIVITPSPARTKKTEETATTPESTRSSKSSSYRSLTSLRRGSMLSMASLSSGKTRESEPSRPRSRSSPGRSPSQDGALADAPSPTKTILMANSRSANNRRLQRILSGSQRRGPPKVRDNRSGSGSLLLSPNHANTRGRGNPGSAAGQYRPFLRDERSKDTLRTIMSVGSTDVLGLHNNNTQEAVKDIPKEAAKESLGETFTESSKEVLKESKAERPALLTRRRNSLRAATRSVAQAAAALFSSDKSPSSKSSKEVKSENDNQKASVPESASVRRPSATGSVNQLPARYRNRSDPNRQSFSRPSSANPVPNSPKPQSHETVSSISSQAKKPKTAPPISMPVSMRTRSVNIPRNHVPNGPLSPPAADVAPSRRRSLPRDLHREYTHAYPPAQPGVGVYGMPLTGVVPLNNQQMPGFVGYQAMPTLVGSGLYVPGSAVSQPMVQPVAQPVIQPSYNRRHSMPVQDARPSPAMVRARNSAPSQPQMMQPRRGVSHSHVQPGPNGHVLGHQAPLQHFPQPIVQSADFVPYPNNNAAAPRPNQAAHRRASSHGSLYGNNPPFRVLHSYNSPAYRGVPIWG